MMPTLLSLLTPEVDTMQTLLSIMSPKIYMILTLLSLVIPEVVIMTTFGAAEWRQSCHHNKCLLCCYYNTIFVHSARLPCGVIIP